MKACVYLKLIEKIIMQGTEAFCSGGDQALRSKDGYADYENFGRLNVLDLQVKHLVLEIQACMTFFNDPC